MKKSPEKLRAKTDELVAALATIETIMVDTQRKIDSSLHPMRETVLKRYPTLFTLLVTLGATTTFLGLEQIVLSIEFFNRHPGVILAIGVAILVITGRAYKKLS